MAQIYEFGTAPIAAQGGYRIIRVITGTKAGVLALFEHQDVRLVTGPSIFGRADEFEFAVMAGPAFRMTDDQIALEAMRIVELSLPYSRELLEQFDHLGLPFFMTGELYGPAPDNAAVLVQYGSDWTGLAVNNDGSTPVYWFMYQCPSFHERAMSCLGIFPSVAAAIDAAIKVVSNDLKHWDGFAKAA
jgi:hypothetical protein